MKLGRRQFNLLGLSIPFAPAIPTLLKAESDRSYWQVDWHFQVQNMISKEGRSLSDLEEMSTIKNATLEEALEVYKFIKVNLAVRWERVHYIRLVKSEYADLTARSTHYRAKRDTVNGNRYGQRYLNERGERVASFSEGRYVVWIPDTYQPIGEFWAFDVPNTSNPYERFAEILVGATGRP